MRIVTQNKKRIHIRDFFQKEHLLTIFTCIRDFCKQTELLRRFPVTLLFLICIVVVNIWKLAQSVDRIQDVDVAPAVAQLQSESDALAEKPQSAPSAPPQATSPASASEAYFQTVDDSYFSDALFIGDSRSEGLALYGNLSDADYFTNVGMSIFEVTEVRAGNPNLREQITLEEKLKQKQYGKIYLMLGLNELGTGTAQSWSDAYADVVAQIRKEQPDAIIYLQSILPVSAENDDPNGAINNAAVQDHNRALEHMADPAQQIYYLNVAEAVTDANGCLNAAYTSDGIHLLGNSLYLWEDYLKAHAVLPDAADASAIS